LGVITLDTNLPRKGDMHLHVLTMTITKDNLFVDRINSPPQLSDNLAALYNKNLQYAGISEYGSYLIPTARAFAYGLLSQGRIKSSTVSDVSRLPFCDQYIPYQFIRPFILGTFELYRSYGWDHTSAVDRQIFCQAAHAFSSQEFHERLLYRPLDADALCPQGSSIKECWEHVRGNDGDRCEKYRFIYKSVRERLNPAWSVVDNNSTGNNGIALHLLGLIQQQKDSSNDMRSGGSFVVPPLRLKCDEGLAVEERGRGGFRAQKILL